MINRVIKIRALAMRYIPTACFICMIAFQSFAVSGTAAAADWETAGRSTSLGINYPGGSLKFFLSDRFAAELRGFRVDGSDAAFS